MPFHPEPPTLLADTDVRSVWFPAHAVAVEVMLNEVCRIIRVEAVSQKTRNRKRRRNADVVSIQNERVIERERNDSWYRARCLPFAVAAASDSGEDDGGR